MIVGRDQELKQLGELRSKSSASLVVVSGRRRIGKSALIQQFGQTVKRFIQFNGLAPRPGIAPTDQLKNFAEHFSANFGLPPVQFYNWTEAFSALAKQTKEGEVLILLDEVSWLAGTDSDFPGKLKIAWDTQLKLNSKLILVLCGSVSSWIEQNILRDADFVGRVSLTIRLGEIGLQHLGKFWQRARGAKVSNYEKLKLLAVTGGIPKYLEEINPHQSAEQNIARLCFSPGGILLEEFERIFNEIFGTRNKQYKRIVEAIRDRHLAPAAVAKVCKLPLNGDILRYIEDLVSSGFLARDFNYPPGGRKGRLNRLRIRDNYLRFYLKYVAPIQDRIRSGAVRISTVSDLPGWQSIRGLQFENLVLNNLQLILTEAGIEAKRVKSAGPYFQRKTTRQQPTQIDLLISCSDDTHYIAELKFREQITTEVVTEAREKIKRLKVPKNHTKRPLLIYAGELSEKVSDSEYFDAMIDVARLLG